MASNISSTGVELSDAIRQLVDTVLMEFYVCLPAKVTAYDPQTQFADVQVQLYQKGIDGELHEYPVIPNVPVKHPRANGGSARIHMPITVGDDVLLCFSSRSIDNWKANGGLQDPDDPRKNHLDDAFALIGGSALPDSFSVDDPTAIEIVNGESTMQVFDDGTFNIANGSTDLISNLVNLTQTLSTASTVAGGPFVGSVVATLEEITENLQTLEHS